MLFSWWIRHRLLLPVVLVPPLLLSIGCRELFFSHRVIVQKPMTWACAPERATKDYPEAQPVRFRFVEEPAYEEVVFGKGLCDDLTDAEKVVSVEFEAWGNKHDGLIGHRVLSVDGKKIVNVGGYDTSGGTGRPGPHPLRAYFK